MNVYNKGMALHRVSTASALYLIDTDEQHVTRLSEVPIGDAPQTVINKKPYQAMGIRYAASGRVRLHFTFGPDSILLTSVVAADPTGLVASLS